MIRKFWMMLYHLKTRQRLPRIPPKLANEYEALSADDERVLIRMGARDPAGVRLLLRKHNAASVDALIAMLPHQRHRADSRQRFKRWLARLAGAYLYEPVVSPALKRMRREGRLNEDAGKIHVERRWKR